MKKVEKKLVKSFILGTSLAVSVAFNSIAVMAETNGLKFNINAVDNNENQEVVDEETKENLQRMENAVGVIKGDTAQGKDCLNLINEYIANDWMTVNTVSDIERKMWRIADEANRENDFSQWAQRDIVRKEANAENEFNKQAKNSGLDEFIKECKEAENVEGKVAVITRAIEVSNNNYGAFLDTHKDEWESYLSVVDEVNEAEKALEKAQEKFNEADKEYNSFIDNPDVEGAKEILAETENTPFPYSHFLEEREKINSTGEGSIEELWYYATFWWDEDVRYAVILIDDFNWAQTKRNDAEKDLADKKDMYEALRANKGYSIIKPEKEKYDAFIRSAKNYKFYIAAKPKVEVCAEKVQAEYKEFAAVNSEVWNLINAFRSTSEASNNEAINDMMADIVSLESSGNVLEQNYNQTEELINSGALTDQVSAERIDSVNAGFTKAQNSAASLQWKYNRIVSDSENARSEFAKTAEANGIAEYASKCDEVADPVHKIGAIDKAMEAAKDAHDKFVSDYAAEISGFKANFGKIQHLEGRIYDLEYAIEEQQKHIDAARYFYEECGDVEYRAEYEDIPGLEQMIKETKELAEAKVELDALRDPEVYNLVNTEEANYNSFVKAANRYKDTLVLKAQAYPVYERGQNALAKVVSYNEKYTELIDSYDRKKAIDNSPEAIALAEEIANAQRDLVRAEADYKAADDKVNEYKDQGENARAMYEKYTKEKEECIWNQKIAEIKNYIAELEATRDRINYILDNYDPDSIEYKQAEDEWDYYEYGIDYYIAKAWQEIDSYEYTIAMAYNEHIINYKSDVEEYDKRIAARDAAAQKVEDIKTKIDELNGKKAELEGTVNSGEDTDTPVENPEETVLSENVYVVFEKVKTVVVNNPELLEKLYSHYDEDDDVDIAQDVFNYVVNKLGVETVNYYAEELSSKEITPEVVNTYYEMFMDWINQ